MSFGFYFKLINEYLYIISFPLLELDDFQTESQLDHASLAVYEDEREMIVTYVSTCELQWQSNEADKGQLRFSNLGTSYWTLEQTR